ncbi:hypothetical protein RHCRD62_40433 [Rhodococcus sp. RD6.2]|nr:hypothetical protein RHCRD62_40433 [Rhodococcus sp. RD6.2]
MIPPQGPTRKGVVRSSRPDGTLLLRWTLLMGFPASEPLDDLGGRLPSPHHAGLCASWPH